MKLSETSNFVILRSSPVMLNKPRHHFDRNQQPVALSHRLPFPFSFTKNRRRVQRTSRLKPRWSLTHVLRHQCNRAMVKMNPRHSFRRHEETHSRGRQIKSVRSFLSSYSRRCYSISAWEFITYFSKSGHRAHCSSCTKRLFLSWATSIVFFSFVSVADSSYILLVRSYIHADSFSLFLFEEQCSFSLSLVRLGCLLVCGYARFFLSLLSETVLTCSIVYPEW